MPSSSLAVRCLSLVILSTILAAPAATQWAAQPVPSSFSVLLSVAFFSESAGVTGGYGIPFAPFAGAALYTTNGGTTWEIARVPDSARALVAVQMFTDGTGYFAGAYNLPAGRTGTIGTAPAPAPRMARSGAAMRAARLHRLGIDGSDLYRGLFLKTTDGGKNWSSWGVLPDSTYYVIGIAFKDSATGFVTTAMTHAVEKAGILKTTNGGRSWSHMAVPDSVAQLASMRFANSTTGFAVGYRMGPSRFTGVILRTTDGGDHWASQVYAPVDNFTGVWCTDASTAFASGVTPDGDGVIYKTTDGGALWSSIAGPADSTIFQGICFSPGGHTGFVYGVQFTDSVWGAYASRSTDGGSQWRPTALPDAPPVFLAGGTMLDDRNGYLVGGYQNGSAVIFHTTNGGVTSVASPGNRQVTRCELLPNYPNPFNPTTTIRYVLPDRAAVTMTVWNTLGQQVALLQEGVQDAGHHEVRFNGSDLPSGVFLYRLAVRSVDDITTGGTSGVAGAFTATGKCLLVK